MAKGIYGDPSKVAEEIVEREFGISKKHVDEAYEHGLKLIREAYEKALREAEVELRGEIGRAEEQLRSVVSSLELEVRSEISALRAKFIEEVLDEAVKRIGELKGEKVYEDYLIKILSRLAGEEYEGLVIRVAEDDMDRVQAIISRLGLSRLKLSREPAPIIGGVIAESPDGSVRLDYSLDLLIQMNKHRLMGVASKILFPGV